MAMWQTDPACQQLISKMLPKKSQKKKNEEKKWLETISMRRLLS